MADDPIRACRDRLQDISMKLEQSHLIYLQSDDSPIKLQHRHKLEGIIKEYLCLVPNENKYVFHETADILHRSAATVQDFSGYRACSAWSAIALYAANLLAQPWRKEYKTLRTYSGYYKHEVEANLIGAELTFELMGYRHAGLGVLTLEGPIDPDKVSNVSRDAIVAFVECQILKQIWESVTKNFTISWLEVLEFRENHVGTPEQAIRALNYRYLEKMHRAHAKPEMYRDYRQLSASNIDGISAASVYNQPLTSYDAFPPTCQSGYKYLADNNKPPMMNLQYCHPVDYSFANRCNPYGYQPMGSKYFGVGNPNPYCTAMPTYSARVPTGQLIELETPIPVINYEKTNNRRLSNTMSDSRSDLDEVDMYGRQAGDGNHCEYARVEKKPAKIHLATDQQSFDSWDFVYRNLESLGYSKDLGDREDVLHKKELDPHRNRQKSAKSLTNAYDEHYASNHLDKRRGQSNFNEMDRTVTNGRSGLQEDVVNKKSSYDDLNKVLIDRSYKDRSNYHARDKKYSQTLPIPHKQHSTDHVTKVRDSFRNLELSKNEGRNKAKGDKWQCSTCTYLNGNGKEICEMCGKSKRKGNEDKPLASGGKECPQCTLVNEKNAANCDACGTSLKDSPTYI